MTATLATCLTLCVAGLTPASADAADSSAHILSDGSSWVMPALPPALVVAGGDTQKRVGRRMMDAGIAAALAAGCLKRLTKQSRPDAPEATNGFPGGHAAGAWALAEAAGTEDPKLRPYTYALAAGVTWSRVRLRRHTVWQASAGAALGYGLARVSADSPKGLFGGLFVHKHARAGTDGGATRATVDPPMFGGEPSVTLWQVHW